MSLQSPVQAIPPPIEVSDYRNSGANFGTDDVYIEYVLLNDQWTLYRTIRHDSATESGTSVLKKSDGLGFVGDPPIGSGTGYSEYDELGGYVLFWGLGTRAYMQTQFSSGTHYYQPKLLPCFANIAGIR